MTEHKVVYFSHDLAPGQYFECPYGCGTLSVGACSRLYQEAMSPKGLKEGRRITCRACSIGASHAGVPETHISVSRFLGATWCARCHQDARRLIRGSICVSCYNREREMLIGKNAKGGKPVNGRRVGPIIVSGMAEGRATVMRMEKVTSRLEAVLAILRRNTGAVLFGWIGSPVIRDSNL